jgi:hypothetical protein
LSASKTDEINEENSRVSGEHSDEQTLHPENFDIIDPASFEQAVDEAQLIVAGNVKISFGRIEDS